MSKLLPSVVALFVLCSCEGKSDDPPPQMSGESEESGEPEKVDCWQHFDRASCLAEDESCGFQKGTLHMRFVDGVCEPTEEFGWCSDVDFGPHQVGSTWYDEATGRIITHVLTPNGSPPGWLECHGGCDFPTQSPLCMCNCPQGGSTGETG